MSNNWQSYAEAIARSPQQESQESSTLALFILGEPLSLRPGDHPPHATLLPADRPLLHFSRRWAADSRANRDWERAHVREWLQAAGIAVLGEADHPTCYVMVLAGRGQEVERVRPILEAAIGAGR